MKKKLSASKFCVDDDRQQLCDVDFFNYGCRHLASPICHFEECWPLLQHFFSPINSNQLNVIISLYCICNEKEIKHILVTTFYSTYHQELIN